MTAGMRKVWRYVLPAKGTGLDGKQTENRVAAAGSSSSPANLQIPAIPMQIPAKNNSPPVNSSRITAAGNSDTIPARFRSSRDISNDVEKNIPLATHLCPITTGLYIGNIPLQSNLNAYVDDKIANAFNNSTRKTLSFIAPTIQNEETIVRPSLDTVREGSKRWKTIFIDMEEVIEGGPWLFQGQPIVLQKWEPGMAMRKLQHTQIWIKLRHLPMEFWTTEGLSMVASGVGKPLYPDAITRAYTRLDFARVCVMIDITHKFTKHIIVMVPNEDGGETPCKIDIEYEWLPPKCTTCMSKDCIMNKTHKPTKPPINVYVPKVTVPPPKPPVKEKMTTKPVAVNIPKADAINIERNYSKQDERELGDQFIHCRVTNTTINEPVIITVVYGASEVIDRRSLWIALETLAQQCSDIPWMAGGDFNAVRELNEVCGISGDIRMATEEFNAGILDAGLIPLPLQGEWLTWHNCSSSTRSLWKRLDRILINDRWLARFPTSSYHSLTPRISDHSPLVLHGDTQQHNGGMFGFDNYLARSPDFIPIVQNIWHHEIVGVPTYAVTRKLKALKPVFRLQRRNKGDLTLNVQLAKGFLDEAQHLVSSDRQNELYLLLEQCCRLVLCQSGKTRTNHVATESQDAVDERRRPMFPCFLL
ncbi:UNVERIFIED_CONTAM: hypothetical protein Sindi_0965700 [Sesamum indicum]